MAKNLTPEQFEQACKNAIVAVEKNISKILINATNIASSTLQRRIFNDNKTTAGKVMRYRSKPYQKLRTDAGLQNIMKDLIFTGDLFYSMTILNTAENEVVYGFNNNRTAEIARFQETSDIQVNEPIFSLNLNEEKKALRQVNIDLGKVFISALESFPNIPTTPQLQLSGEDAVSKAQRRNRQKQQKRKAFARKQKQKEDLKAGKTPQKRYSKVESRERAISKAQAKKSEVNTKATKILQERDRAKAELKKNEFARKNLALQTNKAKKYLKVREERLAKVQSQLAKTRSGSKNRQILTKRLEKAQFEIKTAKNKLENIQRVKTAKKTITKSKTSIAKTRSEYSKAIEQIRKKSEGMREMKRIDRAKKLRMGTYKPKKRKKK